mmetsp:Transcript_14976/g.31066  ORF Transcript_14976/g.31066 Transcript_14976/m.31066 type:complete len:202 (-) Transcript_14976:2470-3075(-)
MMNILTSFLLVSSLFQSVAGFGVSQQHHSRRTTKSALHVVPMDAQTPVEVSNAMHSMWIATIDSDIANIQLEEFRKVFAGGIAVMVGGLVSTTLLGTIIDKKDLYANLAAESYLEMTDDPEFWQQMTDGMSPEEKEKAKELMAKIKADRAAEKGDETPLVVSSEAAPETTIEEETEASSPAPTETTKDEAAKASNDMFSDY